MRLHVDVVDGTGEHGRPLQQLAKRVDDRRQVEIAGGDFVQHRREQEIVFPVHDGDLYVGITRYALELPRRGQTAKAAPEDDDAGRCRRHATTAMAPISCRYSKM